jgi:hypothetical protein
MRLTACSRRCRDRRNHAVIADQCRLRRSGGDLGQPGSGIESLGLAPANLGIMGELPGADVAGGLLALTGWLGPRRRRNRPGGVPDVRGLFYQVCLEVATRRGLHVRTVRLTERPMAVDGLVVDQDPRPPAKARRGGTLTVQVWHPPARPVALIGSGRSSPEAASPLARSGPEPWAWSAAQDAVPYHDTYGRTRNGRAVGGTGLLTPAFATADRGNSAAAAQPDRHSTARQTGLRRSVPRDVRGSDRHDQHLCSCGVSATALGCRTACAGLARALDVSGAVPAAP